MVDLIVIAGGVIALAAAGWVMLTYNGFVGLRNRIEEAWSQIDVQLKKRFDLVPNLVETVKGYASHEKSTFTEITKARAAMASAGTVQEKAEAANMLTGALKSLFAVTENYPELKASQNFMMLQEELSGIESKIAFARQFYNTEVRKLNTQVESFPSNVLAGLFNFVKRDYFEVTQEETKPVKVSFQ
ncbi:MAG: LemA family protein [Candidatus Diapherotrites archaeon]|nr:LemA family protein [Candidatus Diapherotrites archaeon]